MAQSHLSEAPACVAEFAGFAENPAPLLVAQYQRIARDEMQTLPFYRQGIPVVAECVAFEGQWLGCVLTPWMLSVVVLPGPEQLWPLRPVASRLALQLPCGNMTFMVGELPETGQLLACSLMSPLDPHLGAEEGQALVSSTLKMLLSLPVQQGGGAVDLGRRRLFGGRRLPGGGGAEC